jgi:hypothetical protein
VERRSGASIVLRNDEMSEREPKRSRTALFALALSTGMLLLSLASGVCAATLDTLPETPAQRVLLDVVVYEPCRDEEVALAGTLSFQGTTVVAEEGTDELSGPRPRRASGDRPCHG